MCLAIPGRVIEIQESELRMAKVAFGPVTKEASLNLVPAARVGDYVIVHAGMALEIVDEQAALETLEAFAELDLTAKRMELGE